MTTPKYMSPLLNQRFAPKLMRLRQAGEIVPGGHVELAIKALALRHVSLVIRYWRLQPSSTQSEVLISVRIARKFGFQCAKRRRVGPRGAQQWVYSIQ